MNFFEFASSNQWLTFFLSWLVFHAIFATINRVMRHWNIHKHGYPPPHCDADGDFKELK